MNEPQVFNVEGCGWRFGQDEDGTPWAVAADVARSFDQRDADRVTRLLAEDERGTRRVGTPGGPQEMAVIFEDGLWELIFLSRKPEARAIKKRVKVILREIRRTGRYSAVDVPDLATHKGRLQVLQIALEAEQRAAVAEGYIAEIAPAAAAWNVLASAQGDFSLRDAAHVLNRDPVISTGQNRLMRALRDFQMVDRKGKPYARHSTHLRERAVAYEHPRTGEPRLTSQIRVTILGLKYLHRRMGGAAPLRIVEEA